MKFQAWVSKFQFKVSFSASKFPIRISKLGGHAWTFLTIIEKELRQFNGHFWNEYVKSILHGHQKLKGKWSLISTHPFPLSLMP